MKSILSTIIWHLLSSIIGTSKQIMQELWDLKSNHSGQFFSVFVELFLIFVNSTCAELLIPCLLPFLFFLVWRGGFGIYSVKHEYEGNWNEKTRLTTCDPHSKHTVVNSNSPQEVAENKEIIFTYDVEFQVCFFSLNN